MANRDRARPMVPQLHSSPDPTMPAPEKTKSLEPWIWNAACSIRGAKDAPKYKDYILPLIFTKRLCDVFDDELNRIAKEVGSRKKAFQLVKADHKLVRFYLPLVPDDPEQPVWSVIRKLSDKIGEGVTSHMRAIARENPLLQGIIDRVDFNATTHGQRDLDDDRLSDLIEAISTKRLGLDDVEADIIGKSYEYLIRKFAEGSGQSAGEWSGATWTTRQGCPEGEHGGVHQFYTPPEVGTIMSRVLQPERGMEIYDPTCGSGPYIGLNHLVEGTSALVARGIESEIKSPYTDFNSGDILTGKLHPYLRKGTQTDFDGVCFTTISRSAQRLDAKCHCFPKSLALTIFQLEMRE